MSGTFTRSSLLNFFVYNTDYGNKEGHEEEKIMLFVPQDENRDVKNKAVGLCQALVQFTLSFNPRKPCECLVTQKIKQYFVNAEGNFWIVMTVNIPYSEKFVKDKTATDYFTDDLQDSISESVLRQSYEMFTLFNGSFSFILNNHGTTALKERMEFFYTRYLQTLNFGQQDLLDVYQGILYLPLDKTEFLKVHCFSNLIENAFPPVNHVCVLQGDMLLWTTLSQSNMKILYKYLTSSLLPSAVDSNDSLSQTELTNFQISSSYFPNPGKFLTAPKEMVVGLSTLPKKAPRIFIEVDNQVKELNLLVYKAFNTVACLMVDLNSLNSEFCVKFHNFIGPQLGNLSNIIAEQILKRNTVFGDQQYRFIYFNSMNLAIKSSVHTKRSGIVTVAPDIMKLLVDMHTDFENYEQGGGELVVKTCSDCWIVGRKSNSREFFVVLNQKNSSLVDIDEELQKLISSNFGNIMFFN